MKSSLSLVLVIVLSLLFISPHANAQQRNKVVVIPLMSDCSAIQTVTSAGGRVWMDRNLGALRVAQSEDDYHAYGWLYQWGRLADGHEGRGSLTTTTLSPDNVPSHAFFITPTEYPYDWRDPQHPGLWSPLLSNNNNPCPAGFRVPTETEWETEIASWSSLNSAGAFASPLKLVMAGRRQIDGVIDNVGYTGWYWSSTVMSGGGPGARRLHIWSWAEMQTSQYRARGYSVRCIKD